MRALTTRSIRRSSNSASNALNGKVQCDCFLRRGPPTRPLSAKNCLGQFWKAAAGHFSQALKEKAVRAQVSAETRDLTDAELELLKHVKKAVGEMEDLSPVTLK